MRETCLGCKYGFTADQFYLCSQCFKYLNTYPLDLQRFFLDWKQQNPQHLQWSEQQTKITFILKYRNQKIVEYQLELASYTKSFDSFLHHLTDLEIIHIRSQNKKEPSHLPFIPGLTFAPSVKCLLVENVSLDCVSLQKILYGIPSLTHLKLFNVECYNIEFPPKNCKALQTLEIGGTVRSSGLYEKMKANISQLENLKNFNISSVDLKDISKELLDCKAQRVKLCSCIHTYYSPKTVESMKVALGKKQLKADVYGIKFDIHFPCQPLICPCCHHPI